MIDDIERYPWLGWFIPIWIILVIAASIYWRKRTGKPLIPRAPEDSLFVERWASGRSFDTLWSQYGGAKNCLLVTVTPTTLSVRIIFPFNLGFLSEIFRVEQDIPLAAIYDIDERTPLIGRPFTTISYTANGRDDRKIELRLRNHARFIAALRAPRSRRMAG